MNVETEDLRYQILDDLLVYVNSILAQGKDLESSVDAHIAYLANREMAQEKCRTLIDAYKEEYSRPKKYVFPWKITIERRK